MGVAQDTVLCSGRLGDAEIFVAPTSLWSTAARHVRLNKVSIATWWPNLRPVERDWLTHHNGEPIPTEIVVGIAGAGCDIMTDIEFLRGDTGGALFLSRHDINWVSATALGE